ncbi:protein spinster homolog 3-like [Zingiber officinale]|uniref:protein spinster homolog 3-like n=1 Tax=Zingiber officinale TaxID=94328 RepID=UPI001C4D8E5F|nr:protein spinster homolog 3-like [Zingiber officinale]
MKLGTAEQRTLVLVNLAAIMERADEALLPSVYKEVGAALHASPTGLGSLTLFRSIVQSACYPLAAYLATRHNRTHVIALGALLWAIATFLVALSNTFLQVAISRGLNGIGLALVTPAIQSLVADSTNDTTRGTAFGWLQLTGNFGSIIGGFLSLSLASTTVMGIAGWRVAFHIVGIISVVVGVLIRLFAVDPHFIDDPKPASDHLSRKTTWAEVLDLLEDAKGIVKVPSFQIIVAQGVTGSFPWSALSFAPMWLELIGFSHRGTGILMGVFIVASALGGLLGGAMGDFFAGRFPNSGRIVLSQISSASAIPLAALLMLVLPDDPSTGVVHGLVMFIMGLSISWNAPATNNPIFAEIVPEKSRTSIYALDRSLESVLSSFAPPTVGILAERVYGYRPVANGRSNNSIEGDSANAASLAKALYTSIAIPMTLCCFIYSFLYCTYPRDRGRARMDSVIASELEQIELDNAQEMFREFSEVQLSEIEMNENQRSVIDIVYEDEDTDDSDERTLLAH